MVQCFLEAPYNLPKEIVVFAIHPDFLSYLQRASCGDRVIWQQNMRLLHCFGTQFSGNHSRLIATEYVGQMFELVYEFDSLGSWHEDNPVGIVFWCADAQLCKHHTILQKINADGSLPVLEIFKDAIRFIRERGILSLCDRRACFLGYRLLRREKMVIPGNELTAILNEVPRH